MEWRAVVLGLVWYVLGVSGIAVGEELTIYAEELEALNPVLEAVGNYKTDSESFWITVEEGERTGEIAMVEEDGFGVPGMQQRGGPAQPALDIPRFDFFCYELGSGSGFTWGACIMGSEYVGGFLRITLY